MQIKPANCTLLQSLLPFGTAPKSKMLKAFGTVAVAVEMTRKNVSAGLLESFSEVCPHCSGRGVVLYEDAATSGAPLPAPNEEASGG